MQERRGSAVVSTSACHAGGPGSRPGPGTLLGVKTWLSTLEIVYLLCLSDETLKAVGPFYLVSMPGEVKDPTSLHWKCVTCRGLHNTNSLKTTPVLAQRWAVWSIPN